ncbi:alpha/beta hydrolase [Croceivirga lutea]|uniref:YheT family hydrolase n=1 Tax=Croceivirga lutea TaxID=1775167 RepID=UPI00163A95B0|nr:alpha/beta fold hydrolase [Croceivirga lutea]GGG37641.1 alpha/beta hydrolase [Croceivirga lutea]
MPLIPSNYKPPFLFRNGHFSTIYAGLVRKVNGVTQKRERLNLIDGDFLDIDWSQAKVPTNKVVVLLHGLEGDAQRHYITGSAKKLNHNGYDCCAVNFRGCSGEPNKLYRSYHSGATEDLIAVVNHIKTTKTYSQIYIMGFSLGGNLLLKYLGEGNQVPKELKAAVAISVPCNLKDACNQLLQSKNALYSARFKKNLLAKLRVKNKMFPAYISENEIKSIVTLKDFDNIYTGPAHGFKDADDYYNKCSCKQFLTAIVKPSLILNAKNDSFLGDDCYPYEEANINTNLYLETPEFGGHVGFWGRNNISYAEERALSFFEQFAKN